MGRRSDLIENKNKNDHHSNYEAPSCGELRMMLRQQNSLKWPSQEDELTLLQELFQFSRQANYYTPGQFYNHVNKMLSVQLSENHLSYIIYCLRKQYSDQALDRRDSHGLKVLELSREIWGVDRGDNKEPKTKVLRDKYEEALRVYVVQELGFGVDCLTASVVETIKKDWEDFRFLEDEFRMMQNRFSLQLCELKTKMHSAQLQRGRTHKKQTSTFDCN